MAAERGSGSYHSLSSESARFVEQRLRSLILRAAASILPIVSIGFVRIPGLSRAHLPDSCHYGPKPVMDTWQRLAVSARQCGSGGCSPYVLHAPTAAHLEQREPKGFDRRLIRDFHFDQTDEEPDWKNFRTINSWGAPGPTERDGMYHEFCRRTVRIGCGPHRVGGNGTGPAQGPSSGRSHGPSVSRRACRDRGRVMSVGWAGARGDVVLRGDRGRCGRRCARRARCAGRFRR